uniref:Protein kinase domain-containing protein n=1 Tax=viral metagenome TaxID=1070528 RepID=A0A6C0BMX2_9ZZZZ
MIDRYDRIPTELRKAILEVNAIKGRKYDTSSQQLMKIYESMSYWDLLQEEWFGRINCYTHSSGEVIILRKFIKNSKGVRVILGMLNGREVVVKSINSTRHTIRDETSVYQSLKEDGCQVPWFRGDFYFWGQPVLVLEKLEPLDEYDDEFKLGREIIRQLEYVHEFGCHSDIKPQNIMKRVTKKGQKRICQYFLIDYGGVASERLDHGYKRWIWTHKWTSQKPHAQGAERVITCTNDFVELAYVMRAIQIWRSRHRSNRPKDKDGDFRTGYKGRLLKFMEAVCDDNESDHAYLRSLLRGTSGSHKRMKK